MLRSCAAAVLALALRVDAQTVTPENQLKAAYVSKFPQFVTWPAAAWDGRPSLEVCVSAPNPFGGELTELLADTSLAGHRYAIREIRPTDPVDGCHVLFIGSPSAQRSPLLAKAAALPILTIGDAPDFLNANGIVAFRMVSGRVRFEVNLAAAQRVGLQISSQLLRLAVAVRGATP